MSISYQILGPPGRDNALFVEINTGQSIHRLQFDCGEQRFRGSAIVREAIALAEETLVVCGHCHWPSPLVSLPGGPQILNVDSRCVVLRKAR